MIIILKILFTVILLTMIAGTSTASLQCNIMTIPPVVTGHPWFTATLLDAYCGFITFYTWVFYKERSVISRIIWFILIMLLGNIAMSAYMLIKLFKLPPDADAKDLLLRA